MFIYLRRGRGGKGESNGGGRTPPQVNSKTPLATIASNSQTPLGHIAHHAVGKLIPSWSMEVATRTWCIILGQTEEELRVISEEFEGEEAISGLTKMNSFDLIICIINSYFRYFTLIRMTLFLVRLLVLAMYTWGQGPLYLIALSGDAMAIFVIQKILSVMLC